MLTSVLGNSRPASVAVAATDRGSSAPRRGPARAGTCASARSWAAPSTISAPTSTSPSTPSSRARE